MTHTNNGTGWIKWAIGFIITILVTVLPIITNTIWSNDKDARARDMVLDDKVDIAILEQVNENSEQNTKLAKVSSDLDWLKDGVRDIKEALKVR